MQIGWFISTGRIISLHRLSRTNSRSTCSRDWRYASRSVRWVSTAREFNKSTATLTHTYSSHPAAECWCKTNTPRLGISQAPSWSTKKTGNTSSGWKVVGEYLWGQGNTWKPALLPNRQRIVIVMWGGECARQQRPYGTIDNETVTKANRNHPSHLTLRSHNQDYHPKEIRGLQGGLRITLYQWWTNFSKRAASGGHEK